MTKGRSNSNASNASNSSFGNSFDQSPLSPPPPINGVPFYEPPRQPSVARPPAVAPKPSKSITSVNSVNNSVGDQSQVKKEQRNDVVATESVDSVEKDDTMVETTLEAAGPPQLPSYNDIMKNIENNSPTPPSYDSALPTDDTEGSQDQESSQIEGTEIQGEL